MALFPNEPPPTYLGKDYKPFTADDDARFPAGFLNGFATAAPQIENGVSADGKGESIYDRFSGVKGNVVDGSSTAATCNSYELWREDIKALKQLGAKGYRFSIAWTRIVPLGGRKDPVNEAGIAYYNELIDGLLAEGITPVATLYHWDTPQALEDRYQSLLNPEEWTKDFVRYADICFERFGDRVKLWITHNEPQSVTGIGYALPILPPKAGSVDKALIAGHSLLLSHGEAVKLYRAKYAEQKGQIGITLCGDWGIPANDSEEARAVVDRRWQFVWDIFASPIYLTGDYPEIVKEYYGDRLPRFSEDEKKLLLGSSDFFGYNCYRYMVIRANKEGDRVYEPNGLTSTNHSRDGEEEFGWPVSSNGWRGTPNCVLEMAKFLYDRYKKPMYNTEFGFSQNYEGKTLEQKLDDKERLLYIRDHYEALRQAAKEGVDIRGAFQWSLLDTWEWCFGKVWRFGAVHVDDDTYKRTLKYSGLEMAKYFEEKIGNAV